MSKALPIEPKVLRPPQFIGWVFAVIALLYTYLIFTKPEPLGRKEYVTLVCAFVTAIVIILILRKSVTIDNDGIFTKSLFRKRFIPWDNIISANIVIETHGHDSGPMWEFITKDGKKHKNTLGGKRNMRYMAEALSMKCDPFVLSELVRKIAEGKNVSLILGR